MNRKGPAHDADTIADALIAYLDSGAAPGTITLENTFAAPPNATTENRQTPQRKTAKRHNGKPPNATTR